MVVCLVYEQSEDGQAVDEMVMGIKPGILSNKEIYIFFGIYPAIMRGLPFLLDVC